MDFDFNKIKTFYCLKGEVYFPSPFNNIDSWVSAFLDHHFPNLFILLWFYDK